MGTTVMTTASTTMSPTSTLGADSSSGGAESGSESSAGIPEAATLAFFLERAADGSIDVEVAVFDATSEPWQGQGVTMSASPGTVGPIESLGGGRFHANVVPNLPGDSGSGEVRLTADAGAAEGTTIALVLPQVDDRWAHAEKVRGLVNTDGTEDSVTVSPNGEWLIVGTYSPVDLYCCLFGDAAGVPQCSGTPSGVDNPACNAAIGPYAAPERPDMPGADRIISPTEITHEVPSVIDIDVGALPPVAAYGFHRGEGGAFDEAFPIALDNDGFTGAPFGFQFVEDPAGGAAQLVFAHRLYEDLVTQGTLDNDVFLASTASFGTPWTLGVFDPDTNVTTWDGVAPLELADRDGAQGNPGLGAMGLWFDDEGSTDPNLWFAGVPDGLDAPLDAAAMVGFCQDDVDEIQPWYDAVELTLYFTENTAAISTATMIGTDPADPMAWDPVLTQLAMNVPDFAAGSVVALGEPSLSREPGGETYLYFQAVIARGDQLDGGIYRVLAREPF